MRRRQYQIERHLRVACPGVSCPRKFRQLLLVGSSRTTETPDMATWSFSKQHRQPPRPAHGALRPGHRGIRVETELGDALEPLLERHPDFHACEVRADAAVDAEAERRMPVLLTVEHDAVGILEFRRIAVG